MAEKSIEMRRKRADGGFDIYYPKTKAANVVAADGKDLQTLITGKIDKPTSAVSGNIAVFDGGAGKLKDGGKTIDDFRTNASSAGRYTGSMSGDDNTLRYVSTGVDFKQAIITYKASEGNRVRIFCDFNRDRYVDLDGGGGYLPAPASSYSGNSFRFSHKDDDFLCFRSTDGDAGNKNFEVDWGVW